jgi:hypothetical protein
MRDISQETPNSPPDYDMQETKFKPKLINRVLGIISITFSLVKNLIRDLSHILDWICGGICWTFCTI